MTDDVVVILPRREAQGLYDLLDGGLAPKPESPLSIGDALNRPGGLIRKKGPPVLVALKSVFPSVYSALEDALKVEETGGCQHVKVADDGSDDFCRLKDGHDGLHHFGSGEISA